MHKVVKCCICKKMPEKYNAIKTAYQHNILIKDATLQNDRIDSLPCPCTIPVLCCSWKCLFLIK